MAPGDAGVEREGVHPSVCVVGAGGLGLAFAGLLSAAGAAVTLLARPGSGAALLGQGVIEVRGAVTADIAVSAGTAAAPGRPTPGHVTVSVDPAAAWACAAVLVTVKGPDLPALAARLRTAGPGRDGSSTYFVGLQNGVVKDEVLSAAFGADRVVGGATVLGCRRLHPGAVVVSGLGTTFLGEFRTPPSGRVASLASLVAAAGLPVSVEADIRSLLWTKFCHAIGVFGVSALTGLPSYDIFASSSLALAYRSLVEEAASVASAEGVRVGDFADLPIVLNLAPPPAAAVAAMVSRAGPRPPGPPGYSSMAQDLAAGRPTEVEEIFGDLVRRADAHGLSVRRAELVYRVVAGLEGARDRTIWKGAT
jgi:2-dehydropantoate 2-reductase